LPLFIHSAIVRFQRNTSSEGPSAVITAAIHVAFVVFGCSFRVFHVCSHCSL
jgi:hypothetical protein